MAGRYYGYNRVSSKEQNLDRGRKNIEDYCAAHKLPLVKVFEDKQSGRNFERIRYTVMKEDVLQSGDTLIVSEYDRLGRADETKRELEYFKANDIRVVFLDIPTTQMDLSEIPDEMARMVMTCINEMLISFYDLMSRTELNRKKKRQREGMEAMKARGEWERFGRPRNMSKEDFAKEYANVESGSLKSMELMRKLGLKKDTYFRYVREYKNDREQKNIESVRKEADSN